MTPRRRPGRNRTPSATTPTGARLHGDSYSDVSSREPDLATTASTHAASDDDRQGEEPSDTPIDAPERLEGSL